MTCRFCKNKHLKKVLDLGKMPLAGGFLKQEDFSKEKRYPLTLNFCSNCFLAQINDIPKEQTALYKHTLFRSGASQAVIDHFEELATEIYARYGEAGVVEIGSNDGTLLDAMQKHGLKCVGIDPVANEYFTKACAERLVKRQGKADVVVSSYTLSHIDDMRDVFEGIKLLLKDTGVLIFETYYLGKLLDELQYDMIYHEHMSYYSFLAIDIFLKRYGLEVYDIKYLPDFRSGCIRFYVRKQSVLKVSDRVLEWRFWEIIQGYHHARVFKDYAAKVAKNKQDLLMLLAELKNDNKRIIGYGATGRGTTIMNYCNIDSRYLDYVADDTPEKQGLYTPGTHVPIRAWDDTHYPDYALVFSWAFIDEIMKKRKDYIKMGGKFILPLPKVKVVNTSKS